MKQIIVSNKLIATSQFDKGSDTFNLSGTAKAFEPFHEQCLNRQIIKPEPTVYPPPVPSSVKNRPKNIRKEHQIPHPAPEDCMWIRSSTGKYELDCGLGVLN